MDESVRRRRRGDLLEQASEAAGELEVEALPPVQQWISTGCTLLDIAIADKFPGGIPLGRTIQVFGAGSTCKTVLGMLVLGQIQRMGGIAFLADTEYTFDPGWAKLFGLKCDNPDVWRYGYWWKKEDPAEQPSTIEELFDVYFKRIVELEDARPKVVVVDSLTSLPTEVESKDDMVDSTYGTSRAKQIGKGFRKYLSLLSKGNTSVFFIDQTRDNIGVTFGPRETTSGGRALEFYSSVRIYLKHAESVKNKRKQEIGIWVDFRVIKNKVASPFRSSSFKILWDYGLDDIGSNIEFLKLYQDEEGDEEGKEKSRKSPRVNFNDKKLYVNDMIKYVEENGLEYLLKEEVWRCWKEYHKTEDRKPRIWE